MHRMSVVGAVLVLAIGCDVEPVSEGTAETAVVADEAALTAAGDPPGKTAHAQPGHLPSLPQPSGRRDIDAASAEPGFEPGADMSLKLNTSPLAAAAPALAPEVSAELVKRQARYLKEWDAARKDWISLTEEEQESRRGALKASIIGE